MSGVPQNENDLTYGGLLGEDTAGSGYVPKFERDLQKAGGSLSALERVQQQRKRNEAPQSADSIDMEVGVPSVREETSGTGAPDVIEEFEIEVGEAEQESGYEAVQEDTSYEEQQVQAAQADEEEIDFVYGEDDGYDYTGSLDDISVESIALDDINADVKLEEMRTDKSSIISSLKSQIQADDLAMSVENRPKLDDMSDKYAPTEKKTADITSKEQLDRDEKELIKTRLKTELETKSEGYDKKKSLAMYKKLMDEQKAKAAKRGFVMLLVTAMFGLLAAVMIYLVKPNESGTQPFMDYLPVGALIFAVLMLIKAKFFKIMSALYFLACTVILIYPGLVGYALNPDNQNGDGFIVKIAMYVAAVFLCAVTFVRLITNEDIEEYYSYKPSKNSGRGR